MAGYTGGFSIPALREAYAGGLSPVQAIEAAYERIEAGGDNPVWIRTVPAAQALRRAQQLADTRASRDLPLYGVPFALKDNIDLAGIETTAGCPQFAYVPGQSAHVVQRLQQAGAVCVGKTNLDQFATGLVGTRSPYGPCRNPFDRRYISGGSSSGSAVSVALEQVGFALGTDTAGSGRIPAAFNNIVGLKPTRGLVSTRGVVPACRSLDCLSIFALDCADACDVLAVAAGFDPADPFSRSGGRERGLDDSRRFAIPRREQLRFSGDREYERLFEAAIERLCTLGMEPFEIDFEPFDQTQRLLYDGPWLAERAAAIGDFAAAHAQAVDPVVRRILAAAGSISAVDAFKGAYRLAELRRQTEQVWKQAACMLLPAAPTVFRIDEIEADPIALNARLGYYTNFANLLDLAAVNVPGGFRSDGLPFGLSLVAPAHTDRALAALGARVHAALGMPAGVARRVQPCAGLRGALPSSTVRLAVVGAHLSGLPLNGELTGCGASLVRSARTAPSYRLYALAGSGSVQRPGMVRVTSGQAGAAIEVEVWEIALDRFGAFVAGVPAPLGIGTVELEDGERVMGFVCEHYAVQGQADITFWGGWRNWLARAGRGAAAS